MLWLHWLLRLDCLACEFGFGLVLEIWVSALLALRWFGIVVVLLYLALGLVLCFVGFVLSLVFLIAVLVCIQLSWVALGGYCLLLGLIA